MASEMKQQGEAADDAVAGVTTTDPGDQLIEPSDGLVDVDGKPIPLSTLVAEHTEMRGRLARVKKDTRTAVSKRRAKRSSSPIRPSSSGCRSTWRRPVPG